MNIVLELIHTDIMRDKLFTFIRSNYTSEDPYMKQVIIDDLSRVFYGGFLQNQILAFFDLSFPQASDASKSLIIHKLLLSIRTPAVQTKILDFLNSHFDHFTTPLKDAFFRTFLEMLPEHDALADALIQSVNSHIHNESQERLYALEQKITEILDADYRRKDHSLMPMLAAHPGFSRNLVIRLAFGPWQNRKIREDFLALLPNLPLPDIADTLLLAFSLVPDLDQDRLLADACELLTPNAHRSSLPLWLEAALRLDNLPVPFRETFFDQILFPALADALPEAFDSLASMDALLAFAQNHPKLTACTEFRCILLSQELLSAASRFDLPNAAAALEPLMDFENPLRARIAAFLALPAHRQESQSQECAICLEVLQGILAHRAVPLPDIYLKFPHPDGEVPAMERLLAVCAPLAQLSPIALSALSDPNSNALRLMELFYDQAGFAAHHWLRSLPLHDNPFLSLLLSLSHKLKAARPSFLKRLFAFLK